MTGNHQAATLATSTILPNATAKPSGGHGPNKFMSEVQRVHSELSTHIFMSASRDLFELKVQFAAQGQ